MSQKNQGPRNMEWAISGYWPGNVMQGVLRQSICLTINKSGLTPEQIAKRIDANEVYVREALDALEAEELVEKVGRGRYRNTFVALGAEDRIELSRDARTKSERMADLLEEALPELQSAWESSPKPGQGFDWNAGIWPLLVIPVRFHGVRRNGSADTWTWLTPPVHPASGKSYWGEGRERVAPEHMFCDFSFMNNDSPFAGFRYGHSWSYRLPFATWRGEPFSRSGGEPPIDRLRLLGAVASGFRDVDSIAKAAQWDIEKVRETAADVIELGVLESTQDGLALTFPVFTSEDDTAMLPAVDRVCKRLAEEADSLAKLADAKLHELGFGYLEEQLCLSRQNLITDAAGESLRVLYNRGILPNPGDPTPAGLCMMGWFEQTRLFAYEK